MALGDVLDLPSAPRDLGHRCQVIPSDNRDQGLPVRLPGVQRVLGTRYRALSSSAQRARSAGGASTASPEPLEHVVRQ